MIADVGDNIRTHQIVQELISLIFVFRIRRHGEDVEERQRPLFRNIVGNIHPVFRFFRPVSRLPYVARPAYSDADITVRQVVDVLRGVEIANIRTQLQQQVGRRAGVVIGFSTVRIFAEIVQHGSENLFRGIQEGDAAAFQLFQIFRLHHQIPAVQRRIFAQHGFHFIDVVAYAGCRPQVRDRVFIVGVVLRDQLQYFRVEIFPVGKLTFIQRLEYPGRQLALKEARRRHHQVKTGAARHELTLQHFVGVKDVIHHFNTGLFFKIRHRIRRNIIRPVINMQGFLFGCERTGRNGHQRTRNQTC